MEAWGDTAAADSASTTPCESEDQGDLPDTVALRLLQELMSQKQGIAGPEQCGEAGARPSALSSTDTVLAPSLSSAEDDQHVESIASSVTTGPALVVGQPVIARFYGEWHPATVRSFEDNTIEVLWTSEYSVSWLPATDVIADELIEV